MSSLLAQVTLGMLGGGGAGATYIAGGAEITVSAAAAQINIESQPGLDIQTGGIGIDVVHAWKALDLENDGYTVDL